ncbi:NAD(P)/FAD-dependent oxidoreductase [Thalassovita mangrovi]|uniref:Sulfide-quinone reductase n=1 Tax=Thalassovita mangrovi TaxID=2692236 RepID=A0A6L8LQB3_9RHOB|nr:FAD-dependent oxidoreductase [Thalassovita mangrovi]MYM55369.1 FAD-dependent oxidoreductase [Thalassovita mangrovi]
MAEIVILGAGIGGLPMAYDMKREIGKSDKITVISNQSYFQFTPSNPWAAVGWRTKKDITIELDPVLKKLGIDFIADGAAKLEPENNKVILESGREVSYDYLIIATGPELAFDEVEGLGPHGGFTHSVCAVDHAVTAYDAWEEFCRDPGPIVVGAVQGASCYGPAYEFAMIMDTELRKRKIRDKVPMTFVTAEPYVGHLGLGGVGDTKGILESEMRHRHIKWITNAKVDKVEDGKMFVTEMKTAEEAVGSHELDFKYSMMLPAFRGIPALRGIEGLVNPRGFVIVDEHQRNPTFKNIYSVGVCIAIPPLEATPVAVGVPKTGYMIESMVAATAGNIGLELEGKEPTLEGSWNAFCLADFGNKGVAFLAQPQNPPRNLNWASEGRWVHLAKIGFEKYFMHKIRKGKSEPFFEKAIMGMTKVTRLK